MIDNPFERGDCQVEEAKVSSSMTDFLAFIGDAAQFGMAAEAKMRAGDFEAAMRLIQRIRYKLQFKNDDLHSLLTDLHFLATGSDDFDIDAWFEGTGEHDYSALDLATNLQEEIAYMSGSDLSEARDEA